MERSLIQFQPSIPRLQQEDGLDRIKYQFFGVLYQTTKRDLQSFHVVNG